MIKRIDEGKVQQYRKEIEEQSIKAYMDFATKGDWESFSFAINSIYRSYAYANQECQQAMADLLFSSTEKSDKIMTEIVDGNFGFNSAAAAQDELVQDFEILKNIKRKLGETPARTYLNGMNPCHQKVLLFKHKASENLDTLSDGFTSILNH